MRAHYKMLPKIRTDRQLLNGIALFISTNDYQYFDIRITKGKIQMQKQMLCVTYKNQELSKLPENSVSLNIADTKTSTPVMGINQFWQLQKHHLKNGTRNPVCGSLSGKVRM